MELRPILPKCRCSVGLRLLSLEGDELRGVPEPVWGVADGLVWESVRLSASSTTRSSLDVGEICCESSRGLELGWDESCGVSGCPTGVALPLLSVGASDASRAASRGEWVGVLAEPRVPGRVPERGVPAESLALDGTYRERMVSQVVRGLNEISTHA